MTLLTLREVAARLGCCSETVRRRAKAGDIEYVQPPGCRIYVPEHAVADYVERHTWPARESRPGSAACLASPTGTSETAATSFRRGLRIARRLNDV